MSIFGQPTGMGVPSNSFDLSHDHKLSLDMGNLVPVLCLQVIPGDVISMGSQTLARFAPMVTPPMHKYDIEMHSFFVPDRVSWPNAEKFHSPNFNAVTLGTAPAHPYFENYTATEGSLGDYLGLPTGKVIDKFNALPFAAYQRICNDYYFDQNLNGNSTEWGNGNENRWVLNDGLNMIASNGWSLLNRRSWQHDYFTSGLPWAQKGNPVTIPFGLSAPVVVSPPSGSSVGIWKTGDGTTLSGSQPESAAYGTNQSFGFASAGGKNQVYDPNGTLNADLTTAGNVTINQLRYAEALQSFLERSARGGSRYTEVLDNFWDVSSSDKRLQRAEFLGGSRSPMVISEVLQTSQTTVDATNPSPQGTAAGHGISVSEGSDFNYFAEEHGFIISIVSVRPRTAYQQGLNRMWSRFTAFDYPWPQFAHLGEMAVKNKEIYYDPSDGLNEATFAYMPQYSDLKYMDARVSGNFRSLLSHWTHSRIFSTRPLLNQSFIECNPDKRIFAVTDPNVHSVYMHILFSISARRKLPKYSIPSI